MQEQEHETSHETVTKATDAKPPVKREGYLRQAWLVIVLSVLYGGILTWVQISLSGKIAENKRLETYAQIPSLVPSAVQEKTVEHLIQGTDGKEAKVFQACDENGQPVGWVFSASGQGFSDAVELLIGLDPTLTKLTGLYVLNQKETPGLGNFITGKDFTSQFAGKETSRPITVTKSIPTDPQEIKAVTGATISSQSVCDIVNGTIAKYKTAVLEIK